MLRRGRADFTVESKVRRVRAIGPAVLSRGSFARLIHPALRRAPMGRANGNGCASIMSVPLTRAITSLRG